MNPSGRAELCRPAWNCSRPNVLRSPKMLTPSLKRPRCRALANMCGCNSILGTSYVMAYGSIHVPTSHQFHRMVQCANFIPIFQSMMEARYSSLYTAHWFASLRLHVDIFLSVPFWAQKCYLRVENGHLILRHPYLHIVLYPVIFPPYSPSIFVSKPRHTIYKTIHIYICDWIYTNINSIDIIYILSFV